MSNIKRSVSFVLLGLGGFVLLLMLVFFQQFNSISKTLPVICLMYCSYLFVNAKSFVEFSQKISAKYIWVFSILVNLLTLLIFVLFNWQSYVIYAIMMASISALSLVVLSINCSEILDKMYPYFKELSSLSYYIYLVHLPLERPIFDNVKSPIVQIILLFTLSIIFAKLLKYITSRIVLCFKR